MNNPYDQNILNVNMQNYNNPGAYPNPNSTANFVDGNQNVSNSKKKRKARKSI